MFSRQGYIGSPSFLHTVIDVYRRLKMVNPGMLFICDPVGVRLLCTSYPRVKEDRVVPVLLIECDSECNV